MCGRCICIECISKQLGIFLHTYASHQRRSTKGEAPNGRTFRAGGMVKENSLVRDGNSVRFVITDTLQDMPVTYVGLLPDLFKEGKGVVAQGKLGNDGMFVASEVLAKHDENYMPPEAKHAMDQAAAAKAAQSLKP